MNRWIFGGLALIIGCGGSQKQGSEASEAAAEPTTQSEPAAESSDDGRLGSLPREAIQSVVRQNMPDIQRCYDAELRNQPDLAGRVVLRFRIAPDGSVSSASVAESNLGNLSVESCIVKDVRGWEFPEPENDGHVIVNYPFNFKPPYE